MNLVIPTCPSCGANQKLLPGQSLANCPYCGSSLLVPQSARSAEPQPTIANFMRLADLAIVAGNPEEAYGYYTRALETDPDSPDAYLGKAEAAFRSGTLSNTRLSELESGIEEALRCGGPSREAEIRHRGCNLITGCASGLIDAAHEHFREFAALDDSWIDYVYLSLEALGSLQDAATLNPADPTPLQAIFHFCERLLAGEDVYDEYDEYPTTRHENLDGYALERVQEFLGDAVARMRANHPQLAQSMRFPRIAPRIPSRSGNAAQGSPVSDKLSEKVLVGIVVAVVAALVGIRACG